MKVGLFIPPGSLGDFTRWFVGMFVWLPVGLALRPRPRGNAQRDGRKSEAWKPA